MLNVGQKYDIKEKKYAKNRIYDSVQWFKQYTILAVMEDTQEALAGDVLNTSM